MKKSLRPLSKKNFIINRHNFEEIEPVIEMVLNSGCDEVAFSPVWFWRSQGDKTALSPYEESKVCLTLKRIKNRLDSRFIDNNIKETLLRYRIGEAVWEKNPCYIGWFSARIRVNGTVFPCHRSTIALGNLYENSFSEIWNGLPLRSFRKTSMTCNGLKSLGRSCDCRFCSFIGDNMRVHRILDKIKFFMI